MENRWHNTFIGGGAPLPGMGMPKLDGEKELEHHELGKAIEQSIAQLPERARIIATMRWYDRLSRGEIANALGITVGTVNKQLTLAARAMKLRLEMHRE